MNNAVLEELVESKEEELVMFEQKLLTNNSDLKSEDLTSYVRNNIIIVLSNMTISNVPSEQLLNHVLSNTPHK
ncbi:hypothetical protein IME_033 [Enterococcus phage IME-EFm1]|uniref:Uncharacterized protein n=1 Tax=Enterococcus phage IME-EFm1 TaxID=1445858 RepID=A0A060ADR5_9CAUD|nr:hypothetical protein IME_033 [Enterococcus phage IME-EFm1]AIA65100.1 hypothetical protein IME_033 [Enterococcus phage IME-EFm1]